MPISPLFLRIVVGLVAVCVWLPTARIAQAAGVTYTVDPEQSLLNLSGSYSGFQFSPQTPGAMSDRFYGAITADLSGGALTFSGGSSIIALDNSVGPFQPMANGAAGSADANYGVAIPAIGEFGAYRSLIFNILSGTVMHGAVPSLTLSYSSGFLDYAGPATGPGQLNFAGASGSDTSGTAASLTISDNTETLMLPFVFALSDASGLQQTFAGSIVATRSVVVPEPSTLALGVAGSAMLFGFWRSRSRRAS